MSREHLIQMLVIDSIEHASDMRRYRWLQQVLEGGFRGFANMSDAELTEETRARRLDLDDDVTEEDPDNNRGYDDGDIEVLLQGYAEHSRADAV